MRIIVAGFLLLAGLAGGAQVDERATNLREKIVTLESVVNSTNNAAEKAKLGETLQRLRRELEVLEERQAIEERERQLLATRPNGTVDMLRDRLRSTDVTADDAESRVQRVIARRKQVAAERDAITGQLEAAHEKNPPANTALIVQLRERLFNKSEELRALVLEREVAEGQIDLAREVDRLRARFKDVHAAGEHPSLRSMFEA